MECFQQVTAPSKQGGMAHYLHGIVRRFRGVVRCSLLLYLVHGESMNSKHVLILVALLLFFASGAVADQFDLTATSTPGDPTPVSISLTLTGSYSTTLGAYEITGISGYVNNEAITSGLNAGTGAIYTTPTVDGWYIEYDNLLYLNAPYFDLYGLGFQLANGTYANLYDEGGDLYAQLGGTDPLIECVTVVDPVAAPEPGTLALLCVGLLTLGALVTRRQIA